jgi:nucleoside-diphosphate-sugar epimerase
MNNRTALVLGATGGIGGEVARRLARGGWRVRAMARHAGTGAGIEWLRGDAMVASDVAAAAEGASVIVHAVNPPGYRKWNELVLPMIDNTIAAARREGARVVLPGTVYNFGPDAFAQPLDETAPQAPVTRKGKIRVELERRLEHGGVKSLIVRAGDFFGPKAGNAWFAQLVKPGKPLRSISYPGRRGVGHQWAYLPDVAETMVQLLEKDTLADFARFHMRGHWDADGTQVIGAIRRAAGAELPVRRFPWPLVWLASPFVPMFHELLEMRYLWTTPVELRNDRLVAELGAEPHTPLDQAVRTTLEGLGSLATHGHEATMPA